MARRVLAWLRARPVRRGVALACAIAALVLGPPGAADAVRATTLETALEDVISRAPSGRETVVSWTFPFKHARCRVSITVDLAEAEATDALDTSVLFQSTGWMRRLSISRVVELQQQSPAVRALAEEFRRMRDARGLDDDEYLELMTAAVQAIPYGEPVADIALPAAMLVSGSGVCTEKSILLGTLLALEGYDTVLWVFDGERHVALGVASEHARFRDTGYAFVETTARCYIGQVGHSYQFPALTARQPQQIALGGTRAYTAGDQVETILSHLRRLQGVRTLAASYVAHARTPSMYQRRYAERALEAWAADGLTSYILRSTHDRGSVYGTLELLGAYGAAADEGEAELPPPG